MLFLFNSNLHNFMRLRRILCLLLLTTMLAAGQPVNVQPTNAVTTTVSNLQFLLRSLGTNVTVSADRDSVITNIVTVQPTNAWAGIFSPAVVPSLEELLRSLAPTAKISKKREGANISYICEWPDVTVRLTVDLAWDGAGQRTGMRNWILGLSGVNTNMPAVGLLIHEVDDTIDAVGSVATPQYDSGGKATALILGLATKLNGFLFAQYAFYDAKGSKIIGLGNAPTKLTDPGLTAKK
jgi:hypothetical protein